MSLRSATCKVLGHRWVFSHFTIPRHMFCGRCGRSRGGDA